MTGSEGFVGRELTAICKNQGIEVVAVDLVKGPNPNQHKADICSKDIVHLIPQEADAIIHLAGLTRDNDCKDKAYACFNSNVMATLNLIEAAKARKIKQFIFASSEWVYGNWEDNEVKDENSFIDITSLSSEYALSKLVSEANLRLKCQYGFCPVAILRFGIIYGLRKENWSAAESIFNAVMTQDEVTVGSLKTGRCFIHVSDIASGIIKSLGLDGFNVINLQGDKIITLGDIIEESKTILNKNVKIIEKSPGNVSVRNVSNKKAKTLLGWEPKIDLEKGLRLLKSGGICGV